MSKKYYAVKRGRRTGIFTSWAQVKKQVDHYSRPVFRGFQTKSAAVRYLNNSPKSNFQTKSATARYLSDLPKSSSADITVYTDGGCRNHGNRRHQHVRPNDPAAWAYLIITNNHRISGTGYHQSATNNCMEMMAFYQALCWLKDHHLQDRSILEVADSRYLLNPITKHWLDAWRYRGWLTKSGHPVKNQGLWKKIFPVLIKFNKINPIDYKWTKGHADNRGNIFVDHLLNRTMDRRKGRPPKVLTIRNRRPSRKPMLSAGSSADSDTQRSVIDLKQNLQRLGYLRK